MIEIAVEKADKSKKLDFIENDLGTIDLGANDVFLNSIAEFKRGQYLDI